MNKQIPFGRQASALIMVILMLVLMVSIATAFMSMVGRQRGSSLIIASQTKSDVAVHQAQSHFIKSYIEHIADASVTYTSQFNTRLFKDFTARTDADGDPFTDDGVPVGLTNKSDQSIDDLVNKRYPLEDMIGRRTGDGLHSRWYNVEFLDEFFQHIPIDDSLTDAEKSLRARTARYVVRYLVQHKDLHGMQCINNNYPNSPVHPGNASIDSDDYIRFQNYIKAYGRSLKSQFSIYKYTDQGFGVQRRSLDPDFASVDPLDHEALNVQADGSMPIISDKYITKQTGLHRDARIRLERAFRGEALKWVDQTWNNVGGFGYRNWEFLAPSQKGRVYSWGQYSSVLIGSDVRLHQYSYEPYTFSPYGDGLRDNVLGGSDSVSNPWQINLLTAEPITVARMVMGLSAQMRHTKRAFRNMGSGGPVKPSEYGQVYANADLFGKDYPEAFPLSLDAGRDVPVVGESNVANTKDYKVGTGEAIEAPRGARNGSMESFVHGWGYFAASMHQENSYLMDIAMALNHTYRDVRTAWIFESTLSSGSEYIQPNAPLDPIIGKYINNTNNSYIDVNETDPDIMINQVIQEVYRILGEGTIVNTAPATSENFYIPGAPSLLAGGANWVGKESDGRFARMAQLRENANTRAMEYALNDMMISLFGKANPHFKVGDPINENIAVDFNGDGRAESTITGWWDSSSDKRIWSWWWDGLGPFVRVDHGFMKNAGWYRFHDDGTIERENGSQWVALTAVEQTDFLKYNDIWLTGNLSYPIKAFSKTGRLFIGKSKIMQGFIRAEVLNILSKDVMASSHRSFIYRVDPNEDGNLSDGQIIMQKDFGVSSSEKYDIYH